MKECFLILPESPSPFLMEMIEAASSDIDYKIIKNSKNLVNLQNKKIIFAIELPITGMSNNLNSIFEKLFYRGHNSLKNSDAILLINSDNQLFTKTTAQSIIFQANIIGCRFMGRPIVEATGDLKNLIPSRKISELPLKDICLDSCRELGKRFTIDNPCKIDDSKILALHSSNRKTSNTLTLWDMVKENLIEKNIREINLENGNIVDCIGCPYKTCKHYGQQAKCFYGGIIVEEVYPALMEADTLVFICPNYNDMITANLVAVINRLTALFRKVKFYNKNLFSIIVSGHSGSDALAKQLISSLNINKTFRLPPYSSFMATANDRGAINHVPNIEKDAQTFGTHILNESKKNNLLI